SGRWTQRCSRTQRIARRPRTLRLSSPQSRDSTPQRLHLPDEAAAGGSATLALRLRASLCLGLSPGRGFGLGPPRHGGLLPPFGGRLGCSFLRSLLLA